MEQSIHLCVGPVVNLVNCGISFTIFHFLQVLGSGISDINFRPGVRSGHTYLGSGNCGATGRVGGCSEADGAMA